MRRLDRIILHIGMPKTGSTAIQDALAAQRQHLSTVGIHYPKAATRGNAHHPLAWSAAKDRKPRDDVAPLSITLGELAHELNSLVGTAILSSEALFHLPARELSPIADWAENWTHSVQTVAYVRPPAAFHEGWYRQLVKTSEYKLTFDDHLARAPVVDTRSRLMSAESVVGRSRLMVRPYIREHFVDGDVIRDFCSALGLNAEPLSEMDQADANPSLDVELVQFKVRLHQSEVKHSPRLASALLNWSTSRNHPERSLFTEKTWKAFVAATESDHREVLQRYELPDELRDHRPRELGGISLSNKRFQQLLTEFRDRFPVIAQESIGSSKLANRSY